MPAEWTANLIGQMHLHGISSKELAVEAGLNAKYLSTVLNGHTEPKNAKVKLFDALNRLIEKKKIKIETPHHTKEKNMKKYTYEFKSLRRNEKGDKLRFLSLISALERGGIDLDNYELMDAGTIQAEAAVIALEKIFERYNINRPVCYHGPSMSVSDVVYLRAEGADDSIPFYCDSIGFVNLNTTRRPR